MVFMALILISNENTTNGNNNNNNNNTNNNNSNHHKKKKKKMSRLGSRTKEPLVRDLTHEIGIPSQEQRPGGYSWTGNTLRGRVFPARNRDQEAIPGLGTPDHN